MLGSKGLLVIVRRKSAISTFHLLSVANVLLQLQEDEPEIDSETVVGNNPKQELSGMKSMADATSTSNQKSKKKKKKIIPPPTLNKF